MSNRPDYAGSVSKKVRPFIRAAQKNGATIEARGGHFRVYNGKELVAVFSIGKGNHRRSVGSADMARERKKWRELGWL
jgi:hypothetical protein